MSGQAPALDLDRLRSQGWLAVPGWLDAAALAAARRHAGALPDWERDGAADEARLRAETFACGAASVSGTPLSRRCLMMGLGPARPDDRPHALWGRRAAAEAPEAGALFAPLAAALGGRVLSCAAEAAYPGHEGRRASAAPAVRAVLLLDDAGPGEGGLLFWPGPAPKEMPAAGLWPEACPGTPVPLSGAAGTLLLIAEGSLCSEEKMGGAAPRRRLEALIGTSLPAPASPQPPSPGPGLLRRVIQFAKLRVLFPLSRRLRAPLTMVNVGAGRQWQHPSVIALDVDPETNLNQDVTQTGLPFPDGSMEAVYSSHCLEHLTRADAAAFFLEARRVLKTGGTLRIVCPDMDTLFDAYERRDQAWFDWCAGSFYAWDGWLRAIGRMAATMTVDRFSDEELARLYREGGREGFCAALEDAQAAFTAQDFARWPDAHKSWWTRPSLRKALAAAGFRDIVESSRDGSRVRTFRDRRYFDYSSPNMSLYIECVK